MKQCVVCKEIKALEDFYNYKQSKDGKCYRCKSCDDLASEKWRKNNPSKFKESARERQLKYKYGINLTDYKKIFEDQGNCCAICGATENKVSGDRFSKISFAVDHDHTTGKNRGILCNQCNRALGMFKDSIEILSKAQEYLRKHE